MLTSLDAALWRDQRVLVLSPTPTHPQNFGNRLRINTVCANLKALGAHIDFVHYPAESDWRDVVPQDAEAEMCKAWDRYYVVPPSIDLHPDPAGAHHGIDSWWDPALETFLKWIFQHKSYDAFIVNYTWLSKALEFTPKGVVRILDTHDRFSGRKELLQANGIKPEFFFLDSDTEEAKGLNRADIVWAVKGEEAEIFRRVTDKSVVVMPHVEKGLTVPPPPPDAGGYLRIGIIGANNNVNRINLEHFLAAALPRLKHYFAPVKFMIAGGICKSLTVAGEPLVELMGRVEDVRDFYRSVDVVIVPMMFSTGLKIKTGEALSMGVPVISTAHAFEGYSPAHRYHRLADFARMAEAIAELAFDPSALEQLRAASRRSLQSTLNQVEESLAQSIAIARDSAPSSLAAVEARAFDAASIYSAACSSVIKYLGYFSRCQLFVASGKLHPSPLLLTMLDVLGRIFVSGEVDVSGVAGLVAARRIQVARFMDVVDQFAPRMVVADVPVGDFGRLAGQAIQTLVRMDQLALLDPGGQALNWLTAMQPRYVLSSQDGPQLRNICQTTGASFFRIPMMHGQPELLEQLSRTPGRKRYDVMILRPQESWHDLGLAYTCAELGHSVVMIGIDPPNPRHGGAAEEDGEYPYLDTCGLISAIQSGSLAVPAVAVDSSGGDPAFAAIIETFERLAVPVVAVRNGWAADTVNHPHKPLGSQSLIDTLRAVEGALQDGPSPAKDGIAVRHAQSLRGDGGWALIWRIGNNIGTDGDTSADVFGM